MNLHRLDLVSLSLFAMVARTGSISEGAKLVHLAVGAASKRMTELEAGLGVTLMDRHSRGVRLTPAGRALLEHTRRILGDVDSLAADLSDYASGVTGRVQLWANTSAVTQFLPQEIVSFMAANEGIRIELEEANSSDVVSAVLDGRAELGILADRTPSAGLQLLPYREDRLVLVVPQGHVLAKRQRIFFAEAAEFDFVSLARGTSLAQRLDSETESLGKRLRLRIQVRSFDAMCMMVAAGLGVAVLPHDAVLPHLKSMKLRKIDLQDDWVHRKLLIGVRDLQTLALPARRFIDHLSALPSTSA
jgi:DNA-binding transcriptional LysR family regulator